MKSIIAQLFLLQNQRNIYTMKLCDCKYSDKVTIIYGEVPSPPFIFWLIPVVLTKHVITKIYKLEV